MTEKNKKDTKKEGDFDYASFSIQFSKVCIRLMIVVGKLFLKLSIKLCKYLHARYVVWETNRQAKKDIIEYRNNIGTIEPELYR